MMVNQQLNKLERSMDKQDFNTNRLILAGCMLMLITLGGFVIWSTTAKLSSASIAPGSIVVESQRKKIQHLNGGWVKAIYVQEGKKVKKGDLLLALSNSQVESDYQRLLQKATAIQATRDRMQASLKQNTSVAWSRPIDKQQINDVYDNVIKNQASQFQQTLLREALRKGQFNQQNSLLEGKLKGTKYQLAAIDQQLQLIEQELDMLGSLLDKGYVSRTKVMALQRNKAEIIAKKARLSAEKNTLSQQSVTIKQDFDTETVSSKQQYTDNIIRLSKELRDVLQSLDVARVTREKVTIRSDHTGTVVGLNVHSVGGVINAGDVLMEIVPDSDNLIVEAIVKSEDIDMVRQGATAKVRLSAYSIRKTAPVSGVVTYVAADRLSKANEKKNGYLIKVKLNMDEVEDLSHVSLYPGMPTEVFILLKERTLWDYFTEPLTTSFYRAFRES